MLQGSPCKSFGHVLSYINIMYFKFLIVSNSQADLYLLNLLTRLTPGCETRSELSRSSSPQKNDARFSEKQCEKWRIRLRSSARSSTFCERSTLRGKPFILAFIQHLFFQETVVRKVTEWFWKFDVSWSVRIVLEGAEVTIFFVLELVIFRQCFRNE